MIDPLNLCRYTKSSMCKAHLNHRVNFSTLEKGESQIKIDHIQWSFSIIHSVLKVPISAHFSDWHCNRLAQIQTIKYVLNGTKRIKRNKLHIAQWSSSLGRGWQNCSKKIRRFFNGYVTTYGKRIKGHVCLYAYFCLFGLETHFVTKFPCFWAFLELLKLI